jgi:23S rRNA pseudouridine2605 synthase
MMERLQKFLSRAGVASRRASETLILEGRITVNGKVVRTLGTKVDPEVDVVRHNTERVRAPAAPTLDISDPRPGPGEPRLLPPLPDGAVYILMNKPVGILCTVHDDRGRPTVMDLLPRMRHRVFPVGRLDEDSEGLLLLTSDGNLTQLLTHPKFEVPKTYDLRIRGHIERADLDQVERGIWLSEGRTGPARMHVRRAGRDMSHVVMTLREGRNREIRRIFARLRHPVLSLRRVELGPLRLGDLKVGQIRRVSPGEVKALYAAALFPPEPGAEEAPRRGPRKKPSEGSGSRRRREGKGDIRGEGGPRKDSRGPGSRGPRREGGDGFKGPRGKGSRGPAGEDRRPDRDAPRQRPEREAPYRDDDNPFRRKRSKDAPSPWIARRGRGDDDDAKRPSGGGDSRRGPGRRDGPGGGRPRGDRPEGGRPGGGGKPRGARPAGDGPRGGRPRGDRPEGGRPRSDRPEGGRPGGGKPRGTRPGGKPTGPRPGGGAGGTRPDGRSGDGRGRGGPGRGPGSSKGRGPQR